MSQRIGEVLTRSLPKLAPEAAVELKKFLTPEALGVMAVVIAAWVAAHFVGVGEAVDIVLTIVGVFAIGMSVFDGIGHLWEFAEGSYNAQSERDLDVAAEHFAKAVAILGIVAVLSILFKNRPRTYKGGPANVGPQPYQAGASTLARPALTSTRSLPAGAGETSAWGDIVISRLGTKIDRRLAALHENVHRVLTPRLAILRGFRVRNRAKSYSTSALSKYLEEAVAETVAQVGVFGFRSAFRGISFPVTKGYVSLLRVEGNLRPFLPEAGGITAGGFLLFGMVFEIWETDRPPKLVPEAR